jgi:hypothetical protein
MKIVITSPSYIRTIWFINNKLGIGVRYFYDSKGSVSFPKSAVDKDFLEDIFSLDSITNTKEFSIDYPIPEYIEDESKIQWDISKELDAVISNKFQPIITSNYVFAAGIKLESEGALNYWDSNSEDFKWKVINKTADDKQDCKELKNIAKVWNSNVWKNSKKLAKFLKDEFKMELEDDYITFKSPKISFKTK